MRMKNHFHIKGLAPSLVLKQRPEGTWKWPIALLRQKRTGAGVILGSDDSSIHLE